MKITADIRKIRRRTSDLRGRGLEERHGGEVEGVRGEGRGGLREGLKFFEIAGSWWGT
jgi:hypothetical protein